MINLFNIFKLNHNLINKTIDELVRYVAVRIDTPCNYPKFSDRLETLYKKLRIDSDLIKSTVEPYLSKITSGSKAKFLIALDDKTQFLVLLIIYYNQIGDITRAAKCSFLLLSKHYVILMKKYLPYCDESIFIQSLQSLSHSHLFTRYKSILKALLYLNQQLMRRYKLTDYDATLVFKFIYEGRHRINQSIKSFVSKYREIQKEGGKSVSEPTTNVKSVIQQGTLNNYIETAVRSLTMYKVIYDDDKLLKYLQSITKIHKDIIKQIIHLSINLDPELVRESYIYLTQHIDLKILQDKVELLRLVVRRLSVKVSKQKNYKNIIDELIKELLILDKELEMKFNQYSKPTKIRFRLALAYYLALYLSLSNNLISI